MLVVGIWNYLSVDRTEEMVIDSISTMKFSGLRLENLEPKQSVLSRFRSDLTKAGDLIIILNHI